MTRLPNASRRHRARAIEDSHRQGYLSLVGETAIVVGDRKELTYLLSQAAEPEHGLMREYLCTPLALR